MRMRIAFTTCAAAVVVMSLAAYVRTPEGELLIGAVVVDASETRVVVSVDEAGADGIGDGVVDRVFVAQREGGRSFQLSGMGRVTYAPARLTVRLADRATPLVLRIADRDLGAELEPDGEVESVFGIASMKPGVTTSASSLLDPLGAAPMAPPSCSHCASGGAGATSCGTSCGSTSCQVTCGRGYSACCNCFGYALCTCCM